MKKVRKTSSKCYWSMDCRNPIILKNVRTKKASSLLASISELLSSLKDECADEYDQVLKKLSDLGITAKLDLDLIRSNIRRLREEFSQELLHNAAAYQNLMASDLNYTEEAENFKRDNYFRGITFCV